MACTSSTAEHFFIHASCVLIGNLAVLLTGGSGTGKSDLALRLIDAGAVLVSDDQTCLRAEGGRLMASPPSTIEGLVEARGIGLLTMPFVRNVPVTICVELALDPAKIERMPEPQTLELCGVKIPFYRLYGLAASAPAIIRLLASGLRPN